jgi:hypothetical protein
MAAKEKARAAGPGSIAVGHEHGQDTMRPRYLASHAGSGSSGVSTPRPAAKLLRWVPHTNAARTRWGFAAVARAAGLVLKGLKLMIGPKGGRWIAMPSTRATDSSGAPKLDRDGKPFWNDAIAFCDDATRDRFQRQMLDLFKGEHPEAFEP